MLQLHKCLLKWPRESLKTDPWNFFLRVEHLRKFPHAFLAFPIKELYTGATGPLYTVSSQLHMCKLTSSRYKSYQIRMVAFCCQVLLAIQIARKEVCRPYSLNIGDAFVQVFSSLQPTSLPENKGLATFN